MIPPDGSSYPSDGSNNLMRNEERFPFLLNNDDGNILLSETNLMGSSKCSKPQMAYEMYSRLLDIASRKTSISPSSSPKTPSSSYSSVQQKGYNPKEIFLSAFTGCNLFYRGKTDVPIVEIRR